MAGEEEREAGRLEIEKKRSAVRRWVTYGAIGAYLVLGAIVVVWLMWAGRYDLAIGVLGGVGGLAGSISGLLVRVKATGQLRAWHRHAQTRNLSGSRFGISTD